MIPGGAEEIEDRRPHRERTAETMNQLAGIVAHDFGAEDPAPPRLGDDFDVAVVGAHEDRLPVIIERIARHQAAHRTASCRAS